MTLPQEDIQITLDQAANQIKITTSRLSQKEVESLSTAFWEFAWKVVGCNVIWETNEKHTQWRIYNFPSSYTLDSIKELKKKLLPIMRRTIPGKAIMFSGDWWS